MVIQFLGDESFRVQSGERVLLVNPQSARFKADLTLRTLSAGDVLPAPGEAIFAGEYEFAGIEVRGFQVPGESTSSYTKTVYAVQWEDMKLVFLGHLSAPFDGDILEALSEPDMLFIPTGEHFLSPDAAAKLARQLEPAIIIPSYTKPPEAFLKAMGARPEAVEKLVLKKKDLEGKKAEVVLLTPQ